MPEFIPPKGVIPPLVTPLAARDRLDVEGFERLIEHVLDGGVHGVFVLGTTGEAPSLTHRLQREVCEQAVRCVAGRVPVLVGITDPSLEESIALAQHAADEGADAVVLATPFYFPMHQSDLTRYVEELVKEIPLPLFLYNMPSHTKVTFEVDTVRALMQLPQVVGVKDSSGQMLYFNKLLQLAATRPGFTILMGPEELMAESVLMGGHGGVCGGANLCPDLYVDLYEAAAATDLLSAHRLQLRVLRISERIYGTGEAPTAYLTGLKSALEMIGICSARLCEPLYQMPPDRLKLLRQHLADLELLPKNK